MAVRQTYLFDEGPAGASPSLGGDVIEVSGITYTASAMHGPFALLGNAIGSQYIGINNSGTVNHSGSIYVKPSVQSSGANRFVNIATSSASIIFAIRVHSDGHFDLSNNSTRQSVTTFSWVANQWYRVDWQYDQTVLAAPTITARFFTSPEDTVPAETLSATQSGIGNNMSKWRLGLISSAATTATTTVDTFRVADGLTWIGPYNPAPPPPGSVTQSVAGAPTQTGFGVVSKLVAATSVRLKVATNVALTQNVTYVAAQTPDSMGYVRHVPSGLSAGTQYYYQLADTPSGGTETLIGTVGKLKTLKPAGTPQNFTVALGACITQAAADPAAMDDWTAWNADVNVFTGDLDYSGTQATDLATQVGVYETQIASAAGLKNMLANAFGYYCTSDHEAGPDNGDSGSATSGGVYTATNIAAYEQVFPYGTLGDTTNSPVHGRYQSWVVGRIRFIMLDIRNLDRSAGAGTDGASKTMLGALQLQWLKDQLVQPELLKVIVSDVAWMGAASITNGEDKWWSYDNERQQISSYIAAAAQKYLGQLSCLLCGGYAQYRRRTKSVDVQLVLE